MDVFALIAICIIWVLPCYIAYEQGKPKNRRGLAWGFCLGWIGVLCLAVLPPAKPQPRFFN